MSMHAMHASIAFLYPIGYLQRVRPFGSGAAGIIYSTVIKLDYEISNRYCIPAFQTPLIEKAFYSLRILFSTMRVVELAKFNAQYR